MNLILFGFKGVGKTYFGKRLAQKTNRPFFDTDEMLAHAFNQSPKQLYESLGKAQFRDLETQAIHLLRDVKDSIIALGGGAICNSQNRDFLQKLGLFVYLQASLETIQERQVSLIEGPISLIYRERLPIYESIPAKVVNVDCRENDSIIEELRSFLWHPIS